MSLTKKVLVVHSDVRTKRRLLLVLADAAYDVRAFTTTEQAEGTLQGELFDLAIVDSELDGGHGMEFAGRARQVQPTMPVILLMAELELSQIIQGIRLGLADVVQDGDWRALLQRVFTILPPSADALPAPEITEDDLAQAESALLRAVGPADLDAQSVANAGEAREELTKISRQCLRLEAQVEKVSREKASLEAELRLIIAQARESAAVQDELTKLRNERELMAASQAAMDEKARALAEARAELAREKAEAEAAKRKQQHAPAPRADAEITRERARLDAWAAELSEREHEQRVESLRHQQQAKQLASERKRWHEDLELLRTEEANLRAYETRLRALQARLESDRVQYFGTNPPMQVAAAAAAPADDSRLRAAWEKVQRASDLLAAERSTFRTEQMVLREQVADLERREHTLGEREAWFTAVQAAAASTAVDPKQAPAPAPGGGDSALMRVSKAPFALARAVLTASGGRKD